MIPLTYSLTVTLLLSFVGDKEVRCWTVKKGTAAPEAAGEIHSDFVKNFIAAEVVSFADFIACSPTVKGFADVKASGKYRSVGPSYIVVDGDIIHFKIGVSGSGKK